MTRHIDEGTIHAWLDGALPPDEARLVAEHTASCESCSGVVAEARGLVAASRRILSALDSVPRGVIPGNAAEKSLEALRDRARRGGSRWWAGRQFLAAASVLIVAGTAAVVWRAGRGVQPPASPAAGRSEIAEATQSAVQESAREARVADAVSPPAAAGIREGERTKASRQDVAAASERAGGDSRLTSPRQSAMEGKVVADSAVVQTGAVSTPEGQSRPRSVLSRAAEAARERDLPAAPVARAPAPQPALAAPVEAAAAGRSNLGAAVRESADSLRSPDAGLARRRNLESPEPALPVGCYELAGAAPTGGRLLGVPRSVRLLDAAAPRGSDSTWRRAVDLDQGRVATGVVWRMVDAVTAELLVLRPLDSTVVRFRPSPGSAPASAPPGMAVAVATRVVCR